MNEISNVICDVFGIINIKEKYRKQNAVFAKRALCKCARFDGYKLQEIGELANTKHQAVVYHLKNFNNEYNYNPAFR